MTGIRGGPQREQGRVVCLAGELDLGTWPVFRTALRRAGSGAEGCRLIVDLREVTFMDCIGLREVCAARRSSRSGSGPEGWVRLVYTAPAIDRLLDAAGLTDSFPRYATVRDAWQDRPAPTLPVGGARAARDLAVPGR